MCVCLRGEGVWEKNRLGGAGLKMDYGEPEPLVKEGVGERA